MFIKKDNSFKTVIQKIKSKIQYKDNEVGIGYDSKGSLAFKKEGTEEYVKLDEEELKKLKGGVFIHNHPNGGPFSPKDLKTACENDINHLVVISYYGCIYDLVIKDKEKVKEFSEKLERYINIAIERNIELYEQKEKFCLIKKEDVLKERIKETIKDFERFYILKQEEYGFIFMKEE